ncbi:MAG: PASTA domain-containing protein, partial [Acidimicrobiales bacterium]
KGSSVKLITGGSGPLVRVPSFKDYSLTQAQSDVRGLGLSPKVQPAALCSAQYINIVCSQSPAAGSHVAPGKTVTLYTAPTQTTTTTQATALVPNVATDTTGQACTAIVNQGFVCGSTSQTPSNLTVGTVVGTNPASGTTQPKGTTINLLVSSGPASVTVPNVVTNPPQTVQQAEATIQGANLVPTVVCQGGSGTYTQQDTVVAQTPTGGNPASNGSQVQITADCSTTTTTSTA